LIAVQGTAAIIADGRLFAFIISLQCGVRFARLGVQLSAGDTIRYTPDHSIAPCRPMPAFGAAKGLLDRWMRIFYGEKEGVCDALAHYKNVAIPASGSLYYIFVGMD
jgi:hypothetical protein